ncbi:murein L,D-transpeptidase family protein [Labrenzia sp. VG12]|uniref:L,D-transpeptidase family protein n=1 Tax=Labrenzia sp. VG12 TaxID=2021862 RepID=UPI0018E063F2|nr:murein L,D-transpeptidase family protein [Labrenzia sp. VG12]
MSVTKKLFLGLFVLSLAASGSVALATVLFSRYSLPGSADLTEVENRVTPGLAKRLAKQGLALGSPVHIRVFKESSELEVWLRRAGGDYGLFRTYPICSYSGALGPKLKEGDRQSPEGFYTVTPGQMNPNSRYHLSFNIGFPNAFDRSHGRTGSFLMVHGNCVSIGCYAMTNAGVEEIYLLANEAFKKGHSDFGVHIFPFRMTAENFARHSGSKWLGFWQNLKEGHDAFEFTRVPPVVGVREQTYSVAARPAPGLQTAAMPDVKPRSN